MFYVNDIFWYIKVYILVKYINGINDYWWKKNFLIEKYESKVWELNDNLFYLYIV